MDVQCSKTALADRVERSKSVIHEALDRFGRDGIALAVTGGKDSTACLWLFRQVCQERGEGLPLCVFIDEGDVFDEIWRFVRRLEDDWSLDLKVLRNQDILQHASGIGSLIPVAALDRRNREALQEFGYDQEELRFTPDSPVMNHLMKTVPLRTFLEKTGLSALATAIRWDEQSARVREDYFSQRSRPPHTRVHPMLHFTERDIWDLHFTYHIPFNELYEQGYRSLGARCATYKESDVPAWLQDLDNTPERAGRGQDKEQIMDQLRSLGYM